MAMCWYYSKVTYPNRLKKKEKQYKPVIPPPLCLQCPKHCSEIYERTDEVGWDASKVIAGFDYIK